MRKRLKQLRDALRGLNIKKLARRISVKQRAARNVRQQRRELVRRRNRKWDRYNEQLDAGFNPEDREMQLLAEEIATLDRRAHALGSGLARRVSRLTTLRRGLRKRQRQRTKLQARARRLARKIRSRNKYPKPGTGPWAGSQSVGEEAVVETAEDFGAPLSSRKRASNHPLSVSNPSSDHNEANTNAYAWDIATFNGADIARQVARALGITGYSTGNYNTYIITRNGRQYRVQILWAVSGHFNHVHVGIRAA